MAESNIAAFSILLLLLWGGVAFAWLLHVAKDRARRVSTLVMVGFALVLGSIAFSKNGDPLLRSGAASPSPPAVSLLLAEVRTNAVFDLSMPSNAVIHEPWLRRGASDDWFWVHSTNDLFRADTNTFRSVRVSSRGKLAFPDGSHLEPFHAVLGILPEPNWTNAPSRFWQAPTVGGGYLFTWESASLDRDPATPGSFQAALRQDGGMVGRYDLPHPVTNFVIAAFGETALSVRGDATNAATIFRANGATIPETSLAELLRDATRFELVWRAAEGDPDTDPDADGLSTRDEIRRHGTDPNQADTDGDGLSDASEILLGSNPLDADENGDGIPDGVASTDWTTNALWAANATNASTSIAITLNAAIPAGASASLVVDDLCIPIRTPATWTLALVPGRLYTYRLNANGAAADLSVSPATNTPPLRSSPGSFPFWTEGSGDVFDGPSDGGSGHMAVPTLELSWIDPGDGSHASAAGICLHDTTEARFSWTLLPTLLAGRIGGLVLDSLCLDHRDLVLAVSETASIAEGIASLPAGSLRFGHLAAVARAHLCDADYWNPHCSVCGIHRFLYEAWHDVDYLTVVPEGLASDRAIVQFPGGATRTFTPAASPVPDLHQPYFYEDAQANVLPESLYDYATTTGYMTPADDPPGSVSFSWQCVEGPSGPLPENGSGTQASFLVPLQGGIYRFRFQCGSLPPGDAVLVLPLAGASVDAVVAAEIAHADQFAAKVNQKYPWFLRNAPANGLKWFWNNAAGDFLGRPDNASSRTVWFYNQVNDDSGMGAVCTWKGRCMRIAKLSSFLCGYACEKIGVSQPLQDASQVAGTGNDASASSSWFAGESFAEGLLTLDECAEIIATASWTDSGSEKVRKLWPNLAPADNFVQPALYFNPNTQFTAPGFLYMEDP